MKILRANAKHKDFITLVKLLDSVLKKKDGDEHSFYAQFNKIDNIKHVVLAYEKGKVVGCGAIKPLNKETMEVKRMYTAIDYRGKGIATAILSELEQWATELSYKKCALETGLKQPDAINLYQKNGYYAIKNYGQYIGISNSKCFEKILLNNKQQQQQAQQ